jgi:hypothetical protein
VANYLNDELLIGNSDQIDKIMLVRNSLLDSASEFAGYVIEASLRLNYTSRVNNHLADIFLYLRWLANDDTLFLQKITEILQRTIIVQQAHIESANHLLTEFYENFKQLTLNFLSLNKFRDFYSSFISKLIDQIIKKT